MRRLDIESHWIVRNHNSASHNGWVEAGIICATNKSDAWQPHRSEHRRVTKGDRYWMEIGSERSRHCNRQCIQYACCGWTCRHDPRTMFGTQPEFRLAESNEIANSRVTTQQDQMCYNLFQTQHHSQPPAKTQTRPAPATKRQLNHRRCHKVEQLLWHDWKIFRTTTSHLYSTPFNRGQKEWKGYLHIERGWHHVLRKCSWHSSQWRMPPW